MHINTLLLGDVSPVLEEEFLYNGKFAGEAARLLEIVGISATGKSPETVLNEFQRGGFFVTHVLECPLELGVAADAAGEALLTRRVPAVAARIRRSLKPKRVVLISRGLEPVTTKLSSAELGCPVKLDDGKPFDLGSGSDSSMVQRLRLALGLA